MTDETNWINLLEKHNNWNVRLLLAAFSVIGIPPSLLDVGCGTGAMVRCARSLGIAAYGVDQISLPETFFARADLNSKFSMGGLYQRSTVDMIICLELAEHIRPENDGAICDTLVDNLAPNGILLFSSAHPGQAGEGHIGVRPAYHWRTLLHDRGVSFQIETTARLSLAWTNIQSPLMWLPENIQVFNK